MKTSRSLAILKLVQLPMEPMDLKRIARNSTVSVYGDCMFHLGEITLFTVVDFIDDPRCLVEFVLKLGSVGFRKRHITFASGLVWVLAQSEYKFLCFATEPPGVAGQRKHGRNEKEMTSQQSTADMTIGLQQPNRHHHDLRDHGRLHPNVHHLKKCGTVPSSRRCVHCRRPANYLRQPRPLQRGFQTCRLPYRVLSDNYVIMRRPAHSACGRTPPRLSTHRPLRPC